MFGDRHEIKSSCSSGQDIYTLPELVNETIYKNHDKPITVFCEVGLGEMETRIGNSILPRNYLQDFYLYYAIRGCFFKGQGERRTKCSTTFRNATFHNIDYRYNLFSTVENEMNNALLEISRQWNEKHSLAQELFNLVSGITTLEIENKFDNTVTLIENITLRKKYIYEQISSKYIVRVLKIIIYFRTLVKNNTKIINESGSQADLFSNEMKNIHLYDWIIRLVKKRLFHNVTLFFTIPEFRFNWDGIGTYPDLITPEIQVHLENIISVPILTFNLTLFLINLNLTAISPAYDEDRIFTIICDEFKSASLDCTLEERKDLFIELTSGNRNDYIRYPYYQFDMLKRVERIKNQACKEQLQTTINTYCSKFLYVENSALRAFKNFDYRTQLQNYFNIIERTSGLLDVYFLYRMFKDNISNNIISYLGAAHIKNIGKLLHRFFNTDPFSSRIQIGTTSTQQCISVPVQQDKASYYLPFTNEVFKLTVTPKAINSQYIDNLYQITGKSRKNSNKSCRKNSYKSSRKK